MTKKFIAIVLSLMVLTSCASKIQETSLIQVSNTEGLPDSLKGINDARLHARADYHTETSGMQRRSLLTGATYL